MLDAFLLAESAVEPFDKAAVEKLRKDTLQLMKAADKVTTFEDLMTIRKAAVTYSDFVKETFYGGLKTAVDASAGEMLKRGVVAEKAKWSKYWMDKIGKETWGLYIALSLPLSVPDGIKDPSYQQGLVNKYLGLKDKWIDKVQREARKAWAVLKEFVGEIEARTGESPKVQTNEISKEVIDGIQVQYEGRDINPTFIERFRAGTKIYAKKVKAVFPQAMRNHLPIVVTFVPGESSLSGPAAYYERDHIRVVGIHFYDVEEMAHTLAHESGHHVYRAYLSGAAQDYWNEAVKTNYQDLKLSDIIAKWDDEKVDLYHLMRKFEKGADESFAVKLSMLVYDPAETRIGGKEAMNLTKADAEELLAKDGDQTFRISTAAITAYAQKNPEEAFCEAFGLYVAYGPGKVPAVVRHWLHVVLPEANIREEREMGMKALRELAEADGTVKAEVVTPLKEEILGTTGQKLKDELGDMPGFKDMTDDFFWSELGDMFKKYKATAVVFAPGVVRALFDFLANVKLPITNAGTDEVKLKTERYDVARLLQILERAKILIPDMMPALEVLKGTVGKAESEKLKNDPHKNVIGYVLHTHFKDRLGGVLRRGGFPMAGLTGLQESLGLTEGVERIETFADYNAALATIKRYREAAMGGRIQGKDTGHEKAADELQAQVNDYLRREKSKGAASRAAAGDDDYRELPYDQRVATMYFKKAAGERGREYYNRELDMLATALEGNKKVRFFLRDVSPAGGVLWCEIDGKESQISKKKVRLKDLNGMLNGSYDSPIVGR